LCISRIIKCLIIFDARCKYEDCSCMKRYKKPSSEKKIISLLKLPAKVGLLELVYLANPGIGIDGSYANPLH